MAASIAAPACAGSTRCKQEHSDVTLVMDHAPAMARAASCSSPSSAREGTGVFQGKVIVRQHSQKVDGQHEEPLRYSTTARPYVQQAEFSRSSPTTWPAGHGATVAQIDGEQLFYLMARPAAFNGDCLT